MRKISFVGAFDKTNLVMYTAKVLRNMNKKVLVIDGTILGKMRYVVPTVSNSKMYITDFEKIDFAIGFQSMEELLQCLEIDPLVEESLPYDYVLIDVDNKIALNSFNINNSYKKYFVTAFDAYSLKRGINILSNINEEIKLTKILYSNDVTMEDEEYVNYLSMDTKIVWNDMTIYCPLLDSDNKIFEENQRINKIKIKRLSNDYQSAIIYVSEDILGERETRIRKSIIE